MKNKNKVALMASVVPTHPDAAAKSAALLSATGDLDEAKRVSSEATVLQAPSLHDIASGLKKTGELLRKLAKDHVERGVTIEAGTRLVKAEGAFENEVRAYQHFYVSEWIARYGDDVLPPAPAELR